MKLKTNKLIIKKGFLEGKCFCLLIILLITLMSFTTGLQAAVEKEVKEEILNEFKEIYICPNNGLSLKESEENFELCPDGIKLLKLVNLMAESGWDKDEILSYNNLFRQGQAIYTKIKIDSSLINDDDVIIGDPNAAITMIEFTDYQCPFCARYYTETFNEIKKQFIDTGKIRYIVRDYPLSFHPMAAKASEATQCCAEQNKEKFLEIRTKIFEKQTELSVDSLKQIAKDIGLNTEKFNKCMDTEKYKDEVKKDMEDGSKVGVSGTPTFLIGKTTSEKEFKGFKISGAYPFEQFKSLIEKSSK